MELFEYQNKIVDKAIKYFNSNTGDKFNLFLEMGLGKTIIALETVKQLKDTTLLVICPKSLIEMWAYNIAKHLDGFVRIDIPENLSQTTWPSFCVVNYEYFLHYGDNIQAECVILDEVHKIKNINSKTHKRISDNVHTKHCLCLTGTPITRDYMDLYGILTCVGSKIWDKLFPTQFKLKYIVNGGSKRTEELMSKIEPYSVFGKLTDFIDMPETHDMVIPVQLTIDQYAELEYIYRSKEPALTRIVRAQQLTSDSIKREVCIQLVKDIIADNQKVVIFTKYDDEFNFFMQYFYGICTGINGKTEDRDTPRLLFQNDPNCKIFIGNLQTASVGLTLTAAHKCIFYSETHNWADAEQSKFRIYRIGQNNDCIYYHLLAVNTIDEMIYESNINKTNLIEDFKNKYGGN